MRQAAGAIKRVLGRPGIRQILIFLLAFAAHEAARWFFTGTYSMALYNAHAIAGLEITMGIFIEGFMQDALLGTPGMTLLNYIYMSAQEIVTPIVVIALWFKAPPVYFRARDTLIATWMLALPIYSLFPTAPPRLSQMGILDTITATTSVKLDSQAVSMFYNPFAAVPSVHMAFAVICSIAVFCAVKRTSLKIIALAWTPLMALAVVATGNHWIVDIFAGFAVAGLGYLVATGIRLTAVALRDQSRRRRGQQQMPGGAAPSIDG